MRISDWSSDVCSSDLTPHLDSGPEPHAASPMKAVGGVAPTYDALGSSPCEGRGVPTGRADPKQPSTALDRKSVEKGMSLSVRVDLGGRRSINYKPPQSL